jgi:hypothetical protein
MTFYETYITGNYGERLLINFFNLLGYDARKIMDFYCGDIRVKNPYTGKQVNVEVKTANKSKENTWKFTLEKPNRAGITDKIDFVILVAIVDHRVVMFIIPCENIRGKRSIKISSNPYTYTGIYDKYRFAWGKFIEALS